MPRVAREPDGGILRNGRCGGHRPCALGHLKPYGNSGRVTKTHADSSGTRQSREGSESADAPSQYVAMNLGPLFGFDGMRERARRRKNGLAALYQLRDDERHVYVVHYSCESFYDRRGGPAPKATSIAVRQWSSGSTESFSVHQCAEELGIAPGEITARYDEIERGLLSNFYECVRSKDGATWVHWNMRDINYGFPALAHRARILCVEPMRIDDSKKIDLARLLVDLHGVGYAPHPRMASLTAINKITNKDCLTGQEESDAFEAGEYVKMHLSTLRKVDVMAEILGRAVDGSLITKSTRTERYGSILGVVVGFVTEHWIVSVIGFIGTIWGIVAC